MVTLKLAGEDLFASELKKTLPVLPQRIGVITSATGAAIQRADQCGLCDVLIVARGGGSLEMDRNYNAPFRVMRTI